MYLVEQFNKSDVFRNFLRLIFDDMMQEDKSVLTLVPWKKEEESSGAGLESKVPLDTCLGRVKFAGRRKDGGSKRWRL